MTDPLELPLRDIHLPDAVPFWPPAPGWWILAALLLGAIVAGWLLYRRHVEMKRSAIRRARIHLAEVISRYQTDRNPLVLLRELSTLLRRLSISLFPRTEVASLTGGAWLEFLDRQSRRNDFSNDAGRLLAEAPYRSEVAAGEAEQVLEYCKAWIDAVGKGRRR